jgi:hypothetical protein
MNKKITLYLLTLVVAILIISCSSESGKIKYTVPTKAQVNEFISKNPINALSIKETDDFTIVLFENETGHGHYVLYKDQNGKLYDTWVKAIGNPKESPVFLGGVASGKVPFVTVIINDGDMLKRAKEIEITFADGKIAREVVSGKGTIVLHNNEKNEEPMFYNKLIIYDKDMKKLYEK